MLSRFYPVCYIDPIKTYDELTAYAEQNEMKINQEKSEVMLFIHHIKIIFSQS